MLTQEMNKIFKHLPPDNKGGSLAFYGCWLGGRPDGIAMLLSSFCTSRALILEFTEGKRLEINDPAEIEVMDDALIIWRASSLIFYFSPTGKPQPLDKCFHYIFKVSRTNIQFQTNHMHPLMPNFRMPAFEMAWSVPHECSGPEYYRERGKVRLPK
jgi:hypothetical protein